MCTENPVRLILIHIKRNACHTRNILQTIHQFLFYICILSTILRRKLSDQFCTIDDHTNHDLSGFLSYSCQYVAYQTTVMFLIIRFYLIPFHKRTESPNNLIIDRSLEITDIRINYMMRTTGIESNHGMSVLILPYRKLGFIPIADSWKTFLYLTHFLIIQHIILLSVSLCAQIISTFIETNTTHPNDRFHLAFHIRNSTNPFQAVQHLALLPFQLFLIAKLHDGTATTLSCMRADRFHTVNRRNQNLHQSAIRIILLCLDDPDPCHISRHRVLHKYRHAINVTNPFAFISNVLYCNLILLILL